MSTIYCTQTTEYLYEVFCDACHKSVGFCSLDEIIHLTRTGETVQCFDCDGSKCDQVPSQLFIDADIYWLFIDGSQFRINWPGLVREKVHIAELRSNLIEYWMGKCIEHYGARTPLASISNLNSGAVKKTDKPA